MYTVYDIPLLVHNVPRFVYDVPRNVIDKPRDARGKKHQGTVRVFITLITTVIINTHAFALDKSNCLLKPAIPVQKSLSLAANNLLQQAENARQVENYCLALEYLKIYRRLYGLDRNYWRILARTYSDAGYYDEAININTKLLQQQPRNEYLLTTQANTLNLDNKPTQALAVSEKLPILHASILDGLKDKTSIGQQFISLNNIDAANYIPTGPEFIYQNDSIMIYRAPLFLQKHFDENNILIVKYQYENYFAAIGSGLETINGHNNIYDNEIYVGIKSIINEFIQVQALIADLAINGYNNFINYDINTDFLPNDYLTLSLDIYRDLFRPVNIYNGSPRMVSLQIIETSERAHMAYMPDVQTSINMDIRYGTFSDTNSYYYLIFTPYRTFYNTDSIKISFGLDLEWEQFAKDLNINGYYSPQLYQFYQVSALIRYKASEKLDLELYGGMGTVKDNFTPEFGFSTYAVFGGRYKLTSKVDLTGQLVHIYQQLNPSYFEVDAFFGINWKTD